MSVKTLSHYVAGEWLTTNDGEWTADVNPSDATQVLARIPSGQPEMIDRAVEAAQSAFAVWRATAGPERAEVLHRAANLLAELGQDLAMLVTLEARRDIRTSVGGSARANHRRGARTGK